MNSILMVISITEKWSSINIIIFTTCKKGGKQLPLFFFEQWFFFNKKVTFEKMFAFKSFFQEAFH